MQSEDWYDLDILGCVRKVFVVRQVVGFRPITNKCPVIFLESQYQNCFTSMKTHLNGGTILNEVD